MNLIEYALELKLKENPFALLDVDCDQIENWQELAHILRLRT